MSVDSRLMNKEKERAEKIAKKISEIETHSNFRKVTKGQIKEHIDKVMANKNGPYFYTETNQAPQVEWTELPYLIRPCTLFQNTFIISGFNYSCGPKVSSENNAILKINVSFDNFEILFRPIENGFELCTVVSKQVMPLGKRIYSSLKELIDHVSKNDFQTIVDLEKADGEFRVPLARIIRKNISMNSIITNYFEAVKKELGNTKTGFNIIWWADRKLWIDALSKEKTTEQSSKPIQNNVLLNNVQAQHNVLQHNIQLEVKQIKEKEKLETQGDKEQLQVKVPARSLEHLKASSRSTLFDILDETTIGVFRCFNVAIFYAKQEHTSLIKAGASQTDIKEVYDNLETIKFIYDGYFAATCRNRMEQRLSETTDFGLTPEVLAKMDYIKQKFNDFKQEMIMKANLSICPCCDEIHDALQQKILSEALDKDNKLTDQFDSHHVLYLIGKEKYDNYFKHNKTKLYDIEKTRRDMTEQLYNAKMKLEKLLESKASPSQVKAARKVCIDLELSMLGYLSFRIAPLMSELCAVLLEFISVIEKYHQTIKNIKSKHKQIKKSEAINQEDAVTQKKPETIIQQLEEIRLKAGLPDIFNGDKQKRDYVYLCIHYAIECSRHLAVPEGDTTDEVMRQYKRSEKSNGRKAV